jgi:hypothetical protein
VLYPGIAVAMPVEVLVGILVVIYVRAVMVPGIFVFTLDVNDPGIRRGREIKNGKSQQDERKKFFHYDLGACVWDGVERAARCKEFSRSTICRRRSLKKDYLSLPASWRKF